MSSTPSVLILGPGRSGKTTLARRLRQRLQGYDLLHSDAFRAGIMQTWPAHLTAELLNYEQNDYYSDFLMQVLRSTLQQGGDAGGVILDGGPMLPRYLVQRCDLANFAVVYLGHGASTAEAIFANIRQHDTPSDWSASMADTELMDKIRYFVERDQRTQQECRETGLRYFDTSKVRDEALKQAEQAIWEQIQNKKYL